MGEINTCPMCLTNTKADVCPGCNTVLTGKHKGEDYTDLEAKERKDLRVL